MAIFKERFDAVVRGMVDHRSNAFVEAINGLQQQAKRAAWGFKTSKNFFAIAYPHMSKLKYLPGARSPRQCPSACHTIRHRAPCGR